MISCRTKIKLIDETFSTYKRLYLYLQQHIVLIVEWQIEFHEDFLTEYLSFKTEVQDDILAKSMLLQSYGSQLGRPWVDGLKGSKYSNMKELRLTIDKEIWRIAFAFDKKRRCILLVGGDKRGQNQRLFYKKLINTADKRFTEHLSEK